MIGDRHAFANAEITDDVRLWTDLKGGCRHAYAKIYNNYVQVLFDYGMHIEPDRNLVKDCIQDLYIYIWQRRNTLGYVKNVRAYLMVGLRRRIIDQGKSGKRTTPIVDDSARYSVSPHESGVESLEASEQQTRDLRNAIDELPSRQREIVYLMFYKDLSYEEIADTMSINAASAYTLAWKAIRSLKNKLPRSFFG